MTSGYQGRSSVTCISPERMNKDRCPRRSISTSIATLSSCSARPASSFPLVRRFGFNPVLGYLGAGAILGPLGVGIVHRKLPVSLLVHRGRCARTSPAFADLGIVFLLFLIGMELSYERLKAMRRLIFGLGGLADRRSRPR